MIKHTEKENKYICPQCNNRCSVVHSVGLWENCYDETISVCEECKKAFNKHMKIFWKSFYDEVEKRKIEYVPRY